MVNITHKSNTLRIAIATAILTVSKPETITAIQNRTVPKGDVFEFARAAGLLGVKKTSDVIPDCHPLPIEFTSITYEVSGLQVTITVEVHTIYKTGVEVEAMHGASVTALTMYDMLKPIDKGVEISTIRLEKKSGGKSDIRLNTSREIRAAVIVCSDSVSKGQMEDTAGKSIMQKLKGFGIETASYKIIPDELEEIQSLVKELAGDRYDLVIFTGGTGLSERDVTVDAILPLIERPIDGIMETARRYGQDRMPYAMLSRGVAGLIGKTLVITAPGSRKGASETIDSLFPQVLHLFSVLDGAGH
jgi:cyclic pyranopterin phosphate synthase